MRVCGEGAAAAAGAGFQREAKLRAPETTPTHVGTRSHSVNNTNQINICPFNY